MLRVCRAAMLGRTTVARQHHAPASAALLMASPRSQAFPLECHDTGCGGGVDTATSRVGTRVARALGPLSSLGARGVCSSSSASPAPVVSMPSYRGDDSTERTWEENGPPEGVKLDCAVTPRSASEMTSGKHYLRQPPKNADLLSQVFHTHLTGPSHAGVCALAAHVQNTHPTAQTVMVPLSARHLGPQASRGSMFGGTYALLPQYHAIIKRDPELVARTAAAVRHLRRGASAQAEASPIEVDELAHAVKVALAARGSEPVEEETREFVSALFRLWDANGSGWLTPEETDERAVPVVHGGCGGTSLLPPDSPPVDTSHCFGVDPCDYALELRCGEAFATMHHGENFGDDGYAQLRAALEAASASNLPRVVIEFEELCFEYAFGRDGSPEKLFDRGCTDFALDFQRLGFESPVDVPAFELHHALDLPKELYPEQPVDLEALTAATSAGGFQIGGWSVFNSRDKWKYRSNEFSNDTFDRSKALLMRQAIALPMLLQGLGVNPNTYSKYTVTMEKMLGIWPFRHSRF